MYFKNNLIFSLLSIILINHNQLCVNSESIELLKVESDIINGLEKYITDYENQINKLKINLEDLKKEHEEANEDVTRYLSNPINAYLLTKRLTTDWKHVEHMISTEQHLAFFKNLSSNILHDRLPSEEDLRNEILRLDRLRKTYNLPIIEVADGYLDGVKYSEPLKAVDCFEIGRQLYYGREYSSAEEWLGLALKKFNYADYRTSEEADEMKAHLLDYTSMAKHYLGKHDVALNLASEAIKLYPKFTHVEENIKLIRKAMLEAKDRQTTASLERESLPIKPKTKEQITYGEGCRGVTLKKPSELKELYCKLYSGETPFLKLAPYKMEVVNLKPKLILIHEILRDHEIEKFINMAEGKMSIATLLDQYKGAEVVYPSRSSQYYMVDNHDAPLIFNLNQRIADITGLKVKTDNESLQISSYDVGGHYTPQNRHMFKIGDKAVTLTEEFGNRMVSTIFYLNDVEKGGATLFPRINTVVFPQKGSALIFYNTLPSGKVDLDIQHAGCPVLKGNKWILTKWVRERDQMFVRPCSLENDDRFKEA